MIARDIELLKYTDSSLHITGVSTKKGVDLIQAAKKEKLRISFSVTPYHCFFCDEDLTEYDTHFKVNPPLRTREDMLAIRNAAAAGIADCISSHHTPMHWDDKVCEFEYAKNGMIGLESLFAVMNSFYTDLSTLINQLTEHPKNITGLTIHPIDINAEACLTFFDPSIEFTFEEQMIKSKSKNSPFIGKKLKGKILGIINNNQLITSL
jgi:dihydroorotase